MSNIKHIIFYNPLRFVKKVIRTIFSRDVSAVYEGHLKSKFSYCLFQREIAQPGWRRLENVYLCVVAVLYKTRPLRSNVTTRNLKSLLLHLRACTTANCVVWYSCLLQKNESVAQIHRHLVSVSGLECKWSHGDIHRSCKGKVSWGIKFFCSTTTHVLIPRE